MRNLNILLLQRRKEQFLLSRNFLSQPIAVVIIRDDVRNIGRRPFLDGDETAVVGIVLERRDTGISEVTELHLLHMYPRHFLGTVALDGDAEVGLVEEGCLLQLFLVWQQVLMESLIIKHLKTIVKR